MIADMTHSPAGAVVMVMVFFIIVDMGLADSRAPAGWEGVSLRMGARAGRSSLGESRGAGCGEKLRAGMETRDGQNAGGPLVSGW
jgi:hypothetical protein